ncbi:MAG: hypothetical protein ACXWM7_02155 [Parachlamydiaceae bacterium]
MHIATYIKERQNYKPSGVVHMPTANPVFTNQPSAPPAEFSPEGEAYLDHLERNKFVWEGITYSIPLDLQTTRVYLAQSGYWFTLDAKHFYDPQANQWIEVIN